MSGFLNNSIKVYPVKLRELACFITQTKHFETLFFNVYTFNNFHHNSKLTHECSKEEINFLDVTVRGNHGEFITNLYSKPTDGHQYLLFESCHPSHTKSSIIFSQALRMRRICSKKSNDLVGC